MKLNLRILACLAAAVSLFTFASPVGAAILAPGGSTTSFNEALSSSLTVDHTASGVINIGSGRTAIHGSISQWVVTGNAQNPFSSHDLTFIYQVNVTTTGSSGNHVENLAVSDFFGYRVDVGQNKNSPTNHSLTSPASFIGTVPSTEASFDGDVVNFNFPISGSMLKANTHSWLMIVNTNATKADFNGDMSVIDSKTQDFAAWEPLPTPEPGSAILCGSGFAFLAAASGVRRRLQKSLTVTV